MVRSKGERTAGRSFFHLVEQIRAEDKYFNVSRGELADKLGRDKYCEIVSEHETEDTDRATVFPVLRLNLAVRGPRWSASLKLHKIRVDGIDWHRTFDAPDGSKASGWHRHGWNAAEHNAEIHVPIADFGDELTTVNDFLIRMSHVLRITLSANDVGAFDDEDLLGA